jgi:hypothetical protein
LKDSAWGIHIGGPLLGDPTSGHTLGKLPCWSPLGDPFGRPHLGDHRWGTPLEGPPLCDQLWGTYLGGPTLWDPRLGPPVGDTPFGIPI